MSDINESVQPDTAWTYFQQGLGAFLATLRDGAKLILELPSDPHQCGPDAPYAQFAGYDGGGMLRAELPGNACLSSEWQLDAAGQGALEIHGWAAPETGELNWHIDSPIESAVDLSRTVTTCLREVFGVAHPELLTYRAWGPGSEGASALGLTASDAVPSEEIGPPAGWVEPPTPDQIHVPADSDHLKRLVGEFLEYKLGDGVDVDDDGDWVFEVAGQPVFVRVHADMALVEIFARPVHDVRSRTTTLVELGLLNRDHIFVRWALHDRAVFQRTTIQAMPFVPMHFNNAFDDFRAQLEKTRDDLALRVRGKVG